MSPLFFLIVGPVLVFLLIWTAATAYRICYPEHSLPLKMDSVLEPAQRRAEGSSVPVGVRDIRANQRRERQEEDVTIYNYVGGAGDGVPESWREDLWQRRN